MALYKLPGLIDVHVHLRDPGGTHKEDFHTGTEAALAGGVTAVLDMPNNSPPTTDGETLQRKAKIASQKAVCDFGLYLGATDDNTAHCAELGRQVAGLKIYLGETYGPLRVSSLASLLSHFQNWPTTKLIAVHAEDLAPACVIALSWIYDRPVHICHVSRKAEIELIRMAKERGAKVTCEVTPHHLFLTEADRRRLGSFAHVKPPLGTKADRVALWANLYAVDLIASDHAPHTASEKRGPAPPPGVPGLETALPLLLTAVAEGRLALERLVELMYINPAQIFGLRPPEAHVEVGLDTEYVLTSSELKTKCGWTPFEGMTVRGRVVRVYLRGVLAYANGQVLVQPGFGCALF
jgi:carbamoyl-phosphate synthase/aspartate carbamoyltransferase/dihydroorotase